MLNPRDMADESLAEIENSRFVSDASSLHDYDEEGEDDHGAVELAEIKIDDGCSLTIDRGNETSANAKSLNPNENGNGTGMSST